MRVLGIISARGGSKGVHRKNIRPLCGKPLLAYTAEAASSATKLTRTILSTDDEEIADIGKSLGIDVPFMRPVELAEDATAQFVFFSRPIRSGGQRTLITALN
jgi:CMP-N,N'-diacetyllegionaminic acid synthase